MTDVPFQDSRSVVLNGSGNGSVTFGPQRNQWQMERVSVSVSSNANEPSANIYRGTANAGTFISGTYSGSNDTDSDFRDRPMWPGEFYTCVWTDGDPGATATVSFGGYEVSRA